MILIPHGNSAEGFATATLTAGCHTHTI